MSHEPDFTCSDCGLQVDIEHFPRTGERVLAGTQRKNERLLRRMKPGDVVTVTSIGKDTIDGSATTFRGASHPATLIKPLSSDPKCVFWWCKYKAVVRDDKGNEIEKEVIALRTVEKPI